MAKLFNMKREAPSVHSFVPTLLEQKPDRIYINAFCPLCDKAEKSKVEHPSQARHDAASVVRIRAHVRERHGKVVV